MSKNFSLHYSNIESFDKNLDFELHGFGLAYKKNIKPIGKPLYLYLELAACKSTSGIIFSQSLDNIIYNNYRIDDSKYKTQIISESWGLKLGIRFSFQATRFTEIYLFGFYAIDLSTNFKIKFEEEKGLFKKSYKKDIVDGTILYNGSAMDLNLVEFDPVVFGVGFNFGFN